MSSSIQSTGSVPTSESISITININEGPSQSNGSQSRPNPLLDPNGPFANLDLTSQQQQQIAQIFQQAQGSGSPQSWSQILSQVNAVLTSSQQQTLQTDLQNVRAGHHHHGSDGGPSGGNPLAQLDLTSSQQTQIGQIIQSAQASGESPNDVLGQIDNVLTPTQQQQLISFFSTGSQAASSASSSQSSEPYVISTSA